MARFFLEISYNGTAYSGLASQPNANTVQSIIENILGILYKQPIATTTSSRTDAGVHARQNYLHFEADLLYPNLVFKLNAMLPQDIVAHSCELVAQDYHCRFNATSRRYKYYINLQKNAFAITTSWYYPFSIDANLLHETALIIASETDFASFCKKHSDNNTTLCSILESSWQLETNTLVYTVEANRFLRGMVRALVATQLKVARGQISLEAFKEIIASKDCTKANFDAPAMGLFLESVRYKKLPN